MAINLSQAFHRTSASPIDDSLALTKAEMLTVNDNLMPSKYFTICQDDGKLYLYAKSNTPDETTGRFRVFEGGGSGTTDYEDLENKPSIENVELSGDLSASDLGLATETDLQKKQDQIQYNIIPNASEDLEGAVYQYLGATTPTYTHGHWYECVSDGEDPATYSWVEAPNYEEMEDSDMDDVVTPLPSVRARYHKYSTEEQVVGEWIDGSTIYQRTYQLATALSLTSNTWVETDIPIGDMSSIISCNAKNGITYSGELLCGIDVGSNVRVLSTRTATHSINCITLQYTKTSD